MIVLSFFLFRVLECMVLPGISKVMIVDKLKEVEDNLEVVDAWLCRRYYRASAAAGSSSHNSLFCTAVMKGGKDRARIRIAQKQVSEQCCGGIQGRT